MTIPAYVGRYEVRNEVAEGGFATVLEAWDEELASSVALKVLRPKIAENEQLQKKFLEEARLLRRVRCANVVTVHDVGRLQDGRPYLVMDFADRGTLADRLALNNTGEFSAVDILSLVDSLADGLSSVHTAGIIHRDIKPANILFQALSWQAVPESFTANSALIETGERLLIGDLGIAKDLLATNEFTMLAGTPLFKAPEQGQHDLPVGITADIYSATALLFKLITGQSPPEVHLLSKRLGEAPEKWRDFLSKGLAVDASKRYASIEKWRMAAHQVLTDEVSSSILQATTEILSVSSVCPYKGLAAYQLDDASRFFGRERLIDDLILRLQKQKVLVVGGPSGSGKSSLVRAGLLPRVIAGGLAGSAEWQVVSMTPGRDPLAELHCRIVQSLSLHPPMISLEQLVARPGLARQLISNPDSRQSTILLVDQFEEIFTLAEIKQQSGFIEALAAMIDPADSKVKLVIAIRADFYDASANLPWLAQRISENQVLVGPMTETELRRAITEPARQCGLLLESALTQAIVTEATDEIGALPLVAHALVETWKRRSGNKLTLAGFEEAGGVTGAISQTADEVYKDRFNDNEQQTCRHLFLRLVTSRDELPATRRIVTLSELDDDSEAQSFNRIINVLTEVRLLTVDANTVQITHEALLRTWPRLRGWIEESQDDLRYRHRITRAAGAWEMDEQNPDLLYRGTPLLAALEWVDKNSHQLDIRERNFLQHSEQARADALALQQASENKSRRLRFIAILLLTLLSIGASLASIIAYIAFRQSVQNERLAHDVSETANQQFARALGAAALGLVESDPLLALALGNESTTRAKQGEASYDARAAMLQSRIELNNMGPFVNGSPVPSGDARTFTVSDDGTVVAVGRRDGSIQLISSESRAELGQTMQGHRGGIEGMDFSSDGQRLASVDGNGELRIWNIANRNAAKTEVISNSGSTLWSVEFSPNDTSVATAGEGGMVRLWDAFNGQQLGEPLAERIGNFSSVTFDPNSDMLIAGNSDGEIHSVGYASSKRLFPTITAAHTSDVWELEFNPSGDLFASASSDGTSLLFNYPDTSIVKTAFSGVGNVQGIAFTPKASMLLGGTTTGEVMAWSVEQDKLVSTSASGHSSSVLQTDVDSSGRQLVTLGNDQQIRFWKFSDVQSLSNDYQVEDAKAKGVSISPDGRYLGVGDSSGHVRIWRLDVHRAPLVSEGHKKGVWAISFDSTSSKILSADRIGQIKLRSVESGEELLSVNTDLGSIWAVGIAPDDKTFFAVGDSEVRKYDLHTGEQLLTFQSRLPAIVNAKLSSSGKYIAISGKNGHVEVVAYANGALIHDLVAGDNVIWNMAFGAEDSLLATTSADEVVRLWNMESGESLGDLTGHTGGATDAAFLNDNVTLASVDRSGAMHLWDTVSYRRLAPPIKGHNGASWRISLHPDGQKFASTGDDGTIRLWDVMNSDRACAITKRTFDQRRSRQYLGRDQQQVGCDVSP